MDLKELAEYRFWMKGPRLSDLVTGWVVASEDEAILLEITNGAVVTVGDSYICSVTTGKGLTQFRISITDVMPQHVRGIIDSRINLVITKEIPRKRFRGTHTLTYQGESLMVEVIDISSKGVGIITPIELPRRAEVTLVFILPKGDLDVRGNIRYSEAMDEGGTSFRTGIELQQMGRIDRARWNVLVNGGGKVAETQPVAEAS
ncbi:MAG: PilZ domain-containing protein [Armatimonadetes bacterium]|nr:PilZ domain-containing protein [Armatimonadota bacterium]